VFGVPFALALTTGALFAFNPCGFAMLPAYLGAFVNAQGEVDVPPSTRILRATQAGALVTAGVMVVFGIIGVIVRNVSSSILRAAPWVTILIGIVLVVLAIAMLRGYEPKLLLPNPVQKAAATAGLMSHRGMFLYGISYAIVSLGCTLSIFLAQIGTSFASGDLLDGVVLYLAFALGIGLVIITLSIAVSLAQHSFVRGMRRVLPYVQRLSALLLLVSGLYLAYFGWFEQRSLAGSSGIAGSGMVDAVFRANTEIRSAIEARSNLLIGGLILLVGMIVAAAVVHQGNKTNR
jgi:cytochrome c-type biogenesis protein